MKKLLALALALVVLLSTAGCVTLETQIINKRILEREASVLSTERLNTYTLKLAGDDWEWERTGYVEIQSRAMGGDVSFSCYNAFVIENGVPDNFTSYQDDRYTYFLFESGEAYKRAIPDDEGAVDALFDEIGAGLIDSAKVTSLPEGGKQIAYSVNVDAANEGLSDYINDYFGSIVLDAASTTLTSLEYIQYVDDTYLTYFETISVTADLRYHDGSSVTLEYDTVFETLSINTIDEIAFPEGYESLPDISEVYDL